MAEQLDDANETADTLSIKHTQKRRKIDPIWDFINEIDNKRDLPQLKDTSIVITQIWQFRKLITSNLMEKKIKIKLNI
jgi:hypothetical protein